MASSGVRSLSSFTQLRLFAPAALPGGHVRAALPRLRSGLAWATPERRYLTRPELVRLLEEVPVKWRPLFELIAATRLRIPEATGLRWSYVVLDGPTPHLHVKRALVKGAIVAPKSRHGERPIPLTSELGALLHAYRPHQAAENAFVFPGRDGGASDQGKATAGRGPTEPRQSRVPLDLRGSATRPARNRSVDALNEQLIEQWAARRWMSLCRASCLPGGLEALLGRCGELLERFLQGAEPAVSLGGAAPRAVDHSRVVGRGYVGE